MKKFLNQGVSTPLAIVIIVVLAVIVGGAILTYQYHYLPKEEVEISVIEIPKNETTDWKTYKNDEYGFEIKYPSTFDSTELTLTFIKHVPPHGTDLNINGKTSTYDGNISALSLSFNIFPTTINDLEQYVKNKVSDATSFHEEWNKEHSSSPIKYNFTYSEVNMANATGYTIRFRFPESGQDNTQIFTQNSKNFILIFYDSSNIKKVEVIQKIISTFKFTK